MEKLEPIICIGDGLTANLPRKSIIDLIAILIIDGILLSHEFGDNMAEANNRFYYKKTDSLLLSDLL